MAYFSAVAALAEEMAGTASRLAKRAAIAGAIGRTAGDRGEAALADAGRFALYLAGLPFPEADPRKLNAGGALLSRAVLAVSGATDAQMTAAYRRHGDMGAAAFDLLAATDAAKTAVVTLVEVEAAFDGMATAKTTAIRAGLVQELLGRATALEAKYLLKLMLGDMRIGVKESLVEEAIAVAAGAEVVGVRHAVMLEADLAGAVRRAFAGTLDAARMRLFHPLGFMLASPVESPEEAVERFTVKPPKVVAAKKPRKKRVAGGEFLEVSEVFPDAAGTAASAGDAEGEADPYGMTTKGGLSGAGDAEGEADPYGMTTKGGAAGAGVVETAVLAGDAEGKADPYGMTTKGGAASAGVETAASAGAGGDAGGAGEGRGRRPILAFLEDKYDGMRAQVHCGDALQAGRVAIYSRNREDITESFPEIEEAFARVGETTVGGLILDGEILGWDFEQARALPFAVLGQRIGRKRVSNEVRRQIPVVFMAFDLMFAEGTLQLDQPLRDRRNKLEALVEELQAVVCSPIEGTERHRVKAQTLSAFQTGQGALFLTGEDTPETLAGGQPGGSAGVDRLMLSPSRLVESAEDIDRAYAEARARANEGVMLKAAASLYQPGRRGLAWVKLKRELATLDVVITGAEFGSGRRSQFLSDYTFAVRGPEGELLNVGKAYSGVTDAEIVELTAWLEAHTLDNDGHFRTVEPGIVLEVAFNNIMRSDRHASGFALRFPRILRIRTDKPVAEIDTVAGVEAVYQSQVDKPAEPTDANGSE